MQMYQYVITFMTILYMLIPERGNLDPVKFAAHAKKSDNKCMNPS